MVEYIKRDAVLDVCGRLRDKNTENYDMAFALNWAMQRIERIPATDVRPVVRGEWIKIDKYDNESNVQCSACLEEFDYIDGVCYLCHGYELPLFCPNCGADMRGEKDG